MNDRIERMKLEHAELMVKIKALQTFITKDKKFKSLEQAEQVSLITQAAFMSSYGAVLADRVWRAMTTLNKEQR
jgi:hypothetical protein